VITNNGGDDRGYGIYVDGNNNSITDNHIARNRYGIEIGNSALGTTFERNNFIANTKQVHVTGMLDDVQQLRSKWDANYWNRPRIAPKLIVGLGLCAVPGPGDLIFWIPFPIMQVDWHPARRPYEIP
jgi:parallel beta-helix repeat protein